MTRRGNGRVTRLYAIQRGIARSRNQNGGAENFDRGLNSGADLIKLGLPFQLDRDIDEMTLSGLGEVPSVLHRLFFRLLFRRDLDDRASGRAARCQSSTERPTKSAWSTLILRPRQKPTEFY